MHERVEIGYEHKMGHEFFLFRTNLKLAFLVQFGPFKPKAFLVSPCCGSTLLGAISVTGFSCETCRAPYDFVFADMIFEDLDHAREARFAEWLGRTMGLPPLQEQVVTAALATRALEVVEDFKFRKHTLASKERAAEMATVASALSGPLFGRR